MPEVLEKLLLFVFGCGAIGLFCWLIYSFGVWKDDKDKEKAREKAREEAEKEYRRLVLGDVSFIDETVRPAGVRPLLRVFGARHLHFIWLKVWFWIHLWTHIGNIRQRDSLDWYPSAKPAREASDHVVRMALRIGMWRKPSAANTLLKALALDTRRRGRHPEKFNGWDSYREGIIRAVGMCGELATDGKRLLEICRQCHRPASGEAIEISFALLEMGRTSLPDLYELIGTFPDQPGRINYDDLCTLPAQLVPQWYLSLPERVGRQIARRWLAAGRARKFRRELLELLIHRPELFDAADLTRLSQVPDICYGGTFLGYSEGVSGHFVDGEDREAIYGPSSITDLSEFRDLAAKELGRRAGKSQSRGRAPGR